jgi:deazaflavin-dependent oxidoreductase (nitroreductase family)
MGWEGKGMPMIELTTTGRRTGQPRSVMLAAPLHDAGTYTVVASAGGNDASPAWFLNLVADPAVEVRRRDDRQPMQAHVATPEERARWWAEIVAAYPHFNGYQAKTERVIQLVRLSPAGEGS